MWSNDHGERFPWQVLVADGGTKEVAHLPYAALHFVAVSNELNSPKILTCYKDTNRIRASFWDAPLHLSLSYFVGLNADETKADTILSGDRNISTNSSILVGLFDVQNPEALQWTRDIHRHAGNIALADGSVSQTTTETVRKAFQGALATNNAIRLVIP
jgi:prepilin-type processing-associated H-X9-DG protein